GPHLCMIAILCHCAGRNGATMDVIFDPKLVLTRKLRARKQTAEGADFLMQRMAEDLADRLSTVDRRFEDAAAMFSLTAAAARVVEQSGKAAKVIRVESDER